MSSTDGEGTACSVTYGRPCRQVQAYKDYASTENQTCHTSKTNANLKDAQHGEEGSIYASSASIQD